MNYNETTRLIVVCATALGTAAIATVGYVKKNKNHEEAELEKVRLEASYPPEYWKAKEAEVKADADIQKAKIASHEKLTLDNRTREDKRAQELRAFEKDAPAEYWTQREVEEKEKSRRHQMDLDHARSKERDRVDRDIARRNAQALETGTRSLERVITNMNAK